MYFYAVQNADAIVTFEQYLYPYNTDRQTVDRGDVKFTSLLE